MLVTSQMDRADCDPWLNKNDNPYSSTITRNINGTVSRNSSNVAARENTAENLRTSSLGKSTALSTSVAASSLGQTATARSSDLNSTSTMIVSSQSGKHHIVT